MANKITKIVEIQMKGMKKALNQSTQLNNSLNKASRATKASTATNVKHSVATTKGLKQTNKQLVKTTQQMKTLRNVELFEAANESIKGLASQTGMLGAILQKTGLSEPFIAMNKGMRRGIDQGQGFSQVLVRGVNAFKGAAVGAFGSITGMAATLMAVLGPILAIFAAIKVAIFVLKKVWQNNVGGIQTLWFKTIGSIRDAWGKFSVEFNRFMQAISPILKPIFKAIFNFIIRPLKLVFAVLRGAITLLTAIFKPIGDAFKEVEKAFKPVIDSFNKMFGREGQGKINGFKMLIKGIGKVFEILGKIIGFIVKVAITPMVKAFELIAKIIEKIQKFFGKKNSSGSEDKSSQKNDKGFISRQRATGNNISTTNNVNIQPTGNVDGDSAPRLGNMLGSLLAQEQRM